jgi:DNA-binding transcriptional MerR regulator
MTARRYAAVDLGAGIAFIRPRPPKAAGAFRTISEVADELDVPQHVLRFWETRFAQIKPLKRAGGRRYYRPEDVNLLRRIRELLYQQGYTIKGVQKLLRDMPRDRRGPSQPGDGESEMMADAAVVTEVTDLHPAGIPSGIAPKALLGELIDELEKLREVVVQLSSASR